MDRPGTASVPPPSREALDAYLEGVASPEDAARIRRWLLEDPAARGEVLDLIAVRADAFATPEETTAGMPEELRRRLELEPRMARPLTPSSKRRWNWFLGSWAVMATAAAALLLVADVRTWNRPGASLQRPFSLDDFLRGETSVERGAPPERGASIALPPPTFEEGRRSVRAAVPFGDGSATITVPLPAWPSGSLVTVSIASVTSDLRSESRWPVGVETPTVARILLSPPTQGTLRGLYLVHVSVTLPDGTSRTAIYDFELTAP